MYRSRPWTTRQYAGFGTPEGTNGRFKFLIANGQTGLNVAFDLPTQMGLDSDNPLAEGEVGRVGMVVDSLRDFEIAFAGIDLARIGTSLTINAVAAVALAMYQATAEKFGFPLDRISATPQNDILKEMIGRGMWIFPVDAGIRLIGDTIEYSCQVLPKSYPVSVCGYHIRESGATPVQEIAYAFSIAATYIDHVLERGLAGPPPAPWAWIWASSAWAPASSARPTPAPSWGRCPGSVWASPGASWPPRATPAWCSVA